MAKDFISGIIADGLHNVVEGARQQGKSDDEIKAELDKIDVYEILRKMITTSSDKTVECLKSSMFERVLETRAITNEFLSRLDQIWGKAFVASEALYIISSETGEMFSQYLQELDNKVKTSFTYRFSVLQNIHARACQMYLEILTLIKNGLADGAVARWRSLFELSVITNFIADHSEEVAKAYYDASDGDGKWYDWARPSGCFKGSGHINFRTIWSKSGLNSPEWEFEYDLSNCTIHASPQGTYMRISAYKPTGVLSAGYSDYGAAVPAIHSAMSLSFITSRFLSLHAYGDGLVHQYCLLKWIDVVKEVYTKAETEHFSPERKAVAKRMDGSKISVKGK